MSFTAIGAKKTSKEHFKNMLDLYSKCNLEDSSNYLFDDESDFELPGEINNFLLYEDDILISAIHIFAPTKVEAEVTCLTLPSKRKQGNCNLLLNYVYKELQRRNINSILFVCDVNSRSGNESLLHMKIPYEFSEFLMTHKNQSNFVDLKPDVELILAQESDKERLIEINHQAFPDDDTREILSTCLTSDKKEFYGIYYQQGLVGMISIHSEPTRFYIHCFCIDSVYRGKGIGATALKRIVKRCNEKDISREVVLEVQTNNKNALKLYKDSGFEVVTEFKYFRSNIR